MIKNALILALACICTNVNAQFIGCTTFSLQEENRYIFGRNLDTESENGYIFINKRNMLKQAYFDSNSTETPATWTSQYGSITFNQISRDIPHGGMNEMGLVVEHMYLSNANYPPVDSRQAVISHEWIQYVLDNCKNVEEAINIDALVRISDTEYKFPIHFHLMDSSGNRAIIEFIADTYTVYTGEDYIACALANSSYAYSLNYLYNFIGWGGSTPIPINVSGSTDRFVKAADMVKNYPGSAVTPIVEYGFSILDSVSENTKWQLIYDLNNFCVYYRIASDQNINIIYLNNFDYNCLLSTIVLEIGDDPDNISNWLYYSTSINNDLITTTCNLSGFVNGVLGDEIDDISVHPENTSLCMSTEISSEFLSKECLFYPNPTDGLIYFNDAYNFKIITNLQGTIVKSEYNGMQMDCHGIPPGIYFLKLVNNNHTVVKKLVKK